MYTVFMIYQQMRGVKEVSSLGDRIRKLRQSAGLTQEELGKILGVVKSTVSLYESNKSTPDDEIKLKICRYFNVSMDYLLGISDDVVLGTELKELIYDISIEINEPYDKLVDIFLHKSIPKDITRESLMFFFCIILNKGIKAVPVGPPLSDLQDKAIKIILNLPEETLSIVLPLLENLD